MPRLGLADHWGKSVQLMNWLVLILSETMGATRRWQYFHSTQEIL